MTSRIGRGWVSAFLFCDGKQEEEWYLIKGRNVTVKKIIKPFLYYCDEIGISLIWNIYGKLTCINSHIIVVIILYLSIILIQSR